MEAAGTQRRDSPHADLEHAAEQLGAVGDGPAHVDDQLLLDDRRPLVVGVARVDDVLDHPRGQRIGDHLLLVPKGAQRDLAEAELVSHLLAAQRPETPRLGEGRLQGSRSRGRGGCSCLDENGFESMSPPGPGASGLKAEGRRGAGGI